MNWLFLDSGASAGRRNMDTDNALLAAAQGDTAVLRLYRWEPYCLSLGMHQSEQTLNHVTLSEDGIDFVVRPTGGRAVLHAEELTYSVVFPVSPEFTPHIIYRELNEALRTGLALYDQRLSEAELEQQQPHFRDIYRAGDGVACFSNSAKNELKYRGKKFVGSAQRKHGDAVLQHGSILCGTVHKKITRYLTLPDEMRVKAEQELHAHTTELETILCNETDYRKLAVCVREGFERHFAMTLHPFTIDNYFQELVNEL